MGFSRDPCGIGEQLLIFKGGGDECGVPCGDPDPLWGESTIVLGKPGLEFDPDKPGNELKMFEETGKLDSISVLCNAFNVCQCSSKRKGHDSNKRRINIFMLDCMKSFCIRLVADFKSLCQLFELMEVSEFRLLTKTFVLRIY